MMVAKILFLFAIVPLAASSQTIQAKKESSRIEGKNATGYQVAITGSEDEVRSSLSRYLKALGKTKLSGDYIMVAEPIIGGKKYAGALYATTRHLTNTSAAWIGIPDEGEGSGLDRDLEKLAYDFGVTFHRERIQLQIDESLRALETVEKQQLRLINQNRDLSDKVEDNKREKLELEKSLVENKLELEDLTQKLAANAKARDSVAVATEQIKKVVEMHKERQRKVN